MAQIKKVPALRFKGFEEEWEEKRLGEVVEFFSGLTYSPKDVRKEQETLVLRSSNVKNGEIYLNDNVYVDSKVVNSENVRVGDVIVVVRNGSRSLIGKHAIVKKNMRDTVIGAFMTGVRYSESSFLNCLLDSPKFYTEIEKNLGATINQITTGAFKRMEFKFPKYLPEQTQIGNYFKTLDELIALQEHKYTKLKQLKNAMLGKLFPEVGTKVPKIRFKGFTEEWEDYEFYDVIGKIIDFRGRTPKKMGMSWSEEGYLALSALNVKNGFIDKSVDAHFGDQNLYDKWMVNNELHKGQVLFTTEAPMGNVARIPDDNKYILSQRTIAFETKVGIIEESFLAIILSSTVVFNQLTAFSSGGTAKGVSQKSLSNLKISIPNNIIEQQKIGAYFEEFDKCIEGTQKQIEQFKHIKQALLSKMFV